VVTLQQDHRRCCRAGAGCPAIFRAAQFSNGAWAVKQVSNTPHRVGAVCLNGSGCVNNVNRELLDR
jgi:hypothetical protein